MVKTTFENLTSTKQARIKQALLTEFSHYSLAEAQVARIAKQAQIARGAFYQYFDDLTDAYRYLYHEAIAAIHLQINPQAEFSAESFYERVVDFVKQVDHSEYYQLIKMHLAHNEGLLGDDEAEISQRFLNLPAATWSAMVLSHETIKLALLDPAHRQQNLSRFHDSLTLLAKGAED
jgi:AcrR family transcriptional regulator